MKISTLRQIQLSQVSNVDKNNKETYISHAAQLLRNASYAKKSVWGIYSITYTAKNICGAFAQNAILMGFICHAMSLHPEYITSIASVNNYIINNICVKQ